MTKTYRESWGQGPSHSTALQTTIALLSALLLACLLLLSPSADAQTDKTLLKNGHPDRYIVREGDTLWEIAGNFLNDPWRWKELWQSNPDIANPDLIYPGDILALHYVNGQPQIALTRGGRPTFKLSPTARIQQVTPPVPSLPVDALRQLFNLSRVADEGLIRYLPYVASLGPDRTRAYAPGDPIYARGLTNANQRRFDLYRVGQPYIDPDSEEKLGMELEYLGNARLTKLGTPSTPSSLKIIKAIDGILTGAVLLAPDNRGDSWSFIPEPAPENIKPRIIRLHGSVSNVSQYQSVVINKGRGDGLKSGHVFALLNKGKVVEDEVHTRGLDLLPIYDTDWLNSPSQGRDEAEKATKPSLSQTMSQDMLLPDEEAGVVLIYRTFNRVSFGLIMTSQRPAKLGDLLARPAAGS